MEPVSLGWVAQATRGELLGAGSGRPVTRVCTDSRHVRPGDLFVCLEGPRHDGHGYALRARDRGAVGVLAHRDLPQVRPLVRVDDTRDALGRLGRAVRLSRTGDDEPVVVGVTGTNGKTSTKELVAAALGSTLRTVASRRSFNNEIGVPLTLLELDDRTEAVVVEMGTNAPGEIAALTAMVQPHLGIITNIQSGHLQGLGSVEGVREEKASLIDGLVGRRVAILNADDPSYPLLRERAAGPVIGFGLSAQADVRASDVRCDGNGTRFVVGGRHTVQLQLLGRHTVSNALAAIACACAVGIDIERTIESLAKVESPPGRMQVRRLGDLTIIDDTYNSNPGSFAAALATLSELRLPGRLVVVAGDMLELGPSSAGLHREIGGRLAALRPALVVAVGDHAKHLLEGLALGGVRGAAARACSDVDEAVLHLGAEVQGGDVVLLKGSRGVQLDQIIHRLLSVAARVA